MSHNCGLIELDTLAYKALDILQALLQTLWPYALLQISIIYCLFPNILYYTIINMCTVKLNNFGTKIFCIWLIKNYLNVVEFEDWGWLGQGSGDLVTWSNRFLLFYICTRRVFNINVGHPLTIYKTVHFQNLHKY